MTNAEEKDISTDIAGGSTPAFRSKKWNMIGALAILLCMGGFALLQWFSSANERLFLNYYQPLKVAKQKFDLSQPVDRALHYYKTGNFDAAIPALWKAQDADSTVNYALHIGHAQLQLGETEAALETFRKASSVEALREEADWHIVLCHVRLDSKDAVTALQNFEQTTTQHQTEVGELLRVITKE